PPYGPIRSHGTEYDVPVILMHVPHVVEVGEHFRAVVLVNTGEPCAACLWDSLGEAVLRKESIVPARLIERIPGPHARHRGVEGETQPLFALPQGLFGAGTFDRFPDAFGNITDQLDLSFGPDTWRRAMDTEVGDPVLVFYEHYAGECRDLSRPQIGALAFGEP